MAGCAASACPRFQADFSDRRQAANGDRIRDGALADFKTVARDRLDTVSL